MVDVPEGSEGCPGSFALIWEAAQWEACHVVCCTYDNQPPSTARLLRALLAQLFDAAGVEPLNPPRHRYCVGRSHRDAR